MVKVTQNICENMPLDQFKLKSSQRKSSQRLVKSDILGKGTFVGQSPRLKGKCNDWSYSEKYDEEMRCNRSPGHSGKHHYVVVGD